MDRQHTDGTPALFQRRNVLKKRLRCTSPYFKYKGSGGGNLESFPTWLLLETVKLVTHIPLVSIVYGERHA